MLGNVLSDYELISWNPLTSSKIEVDYPNFPTEEKDVLTSCSTSSM